MADRAVDPGAFLIAVLTVGVVPLTEDGPWGPMNSAIAVIVGVLVRCYLWPDRNSPPAHKLAFHTVGALVVAVFLAWPVQSVLGRADDKDKTADAASWISLGLGSIVSVVVFVVVFSPQARGSRMKRWISRHVLIVAGVAAVLIALSLTTVGLIVYGAEMTPNLVAELAGVSVEVAVAAIIVERLMNRHRRREWDFAYHLLAERVSETFVDVMRLMSVRSSDAALKANSARYGSFVRLGERHLADLRSNIEGSAGALDPPTHRLYRRVERRLSWCLIQLELSPQQPADRDDVVPLLEETAVLVFELLSKDGDGHRAELSAAEEAVAQAIAGGAAEESLLGGCRLRAQSVLLQGISGPVRSISSISQDVDNEFAIGYFMIDYLLLTCMAAAVVGNTDADA